MLAFLGGLGLFLLGMHMMTEGLKVAAGHTLRRVLGAWTQTRWRGLMAGGLLTALVQSSSAVTVATLGFVNAGLLSFRRAMWILFGANVGTTATAWIVAAVGLNLKIDAAALPMIGVGMLLATFLPKTRRGALGTALAGFGLFFLGLDVLSGAFDGVMEAAEMSTAPSGTVLSGLLAFALGVGVTALVQSSSATMALAITGAASGVLSVGDGAAMVVGANLGTTSTALLGSVGASGAARRLAGAHVLFNVVTGVVALALLPVLLAMVGWVVAGADRAGDAAVSLAVFHSVFNVLGVVLMVPLAAPMTAWLTRRIADPVEAAGSPRGLDRSVLAVPDLAVQAAQREVGVLFSVAVGLATQSLTDGGPSVDAERAAFAARARAISDFAVELQRISLQPELVHAVVEVVETTHRLRAVMADVEAAQALLPGVGSARDAIREVTGQAAQALHIDLAEDAPDTAVLSARADEVEHHFRTVRSVLVERASRGELDPESTSVAITYLGLVRRIVRAMSDAAAIAGPGVREAQIDAPLEA